MAEFTEAHVDVNGVDTAVLTAGAGETLVFFHGAGTATGFDALLPLADRFRLVVPQHPGFGASADDPRVDGIHDYVLHYLDLFDALGIDQFSLAGHSMGGWLATWFAVEQTRRVRRLVLAAPAGLRVPGHPAQDLFTIPDEQMGEFLTADLSVFAGKVPATPTPDSLAAGYRELTSAARVMWERPYDSRLPRWTHRLTMPTLLLWGTADRIIPVGQADAWADLLPNCRSVPVPGAGHLLFDEARAAVDEIADFVGADAVV
jgi:pimeloyl-ACP methyl ester carboxylesterase